MRRMKPERAHYIPQGATELKDAESSAVAYLYSNSAGQPLAVMFGGKRQKPDSHYRYRSEESRADAVQKHFERWRSTERYQNERRETIKAARKADASLNYEGRDYLPAPAVAALLRQTLKEAFPGERFSIRSDGSLRVTWSDGPSREAVERIAKNFEGSYFDGMIDYKGSIYHELDGQRVRFGADFVFCERTMSREALEIGAAALANEYAQHSNQPPCTFEERETKWSKWVEIKANPSFPGYCEGRFADEGELITPEDEHGSKRFVRPALALERWFDKAQPVEAQASPTLARVKVLGTDGYGNTALEAADGGETCRGYPEVTTPPEGERMREAVQTAAADLLAEMARAGSVAFDVETQQLKATEPAAPHPVFSRLYGAAEPEPKLVECEVIDFQPHLSRHIARAEQARRLN